MEYRLFSGVPCLDLKVLFDKMSSKFLHYVPAVNERAAFGISTGAIVSGVHAGVIIDSDYLDVAHEWFDFCTKNGGHIVVITNKSIKTKAPNVVFDGDYDKLGEFLIKARKKKIPAVIVLKGEDLK
jgi:hypothetical protein